MGLVGTIDGRGSVCGALSAGSCSFCGGYGRFGPTLGGSFFIGDFWATGGGN